MTPQPDLAGLELGELEQQLEARGIPRFHARQLYRWIFKRGVTDFELMTDREIVGDDSATLRPLGGIPVRVKTRGHATRTAAE